MLTKINIIKIISDHLLTLQDYRTKKTSSKDILLFYLLPVLISAFLVATEFKLKEGLVEILITSFSIFTALLFNLLLLTFDIVREKLELTPGKENKDKLYYEIKKDLLKQAYANISYSIFVSILGLLFLLLSQIEMCLLCKTILCGIIYFICFNFILTLFLILTRIHTLLSNEF